MASKDLISSLRQQAEEDYKTAEDLYKSRHYHHALFFGQLVLEKLNKIYDPIHDLKKLASSAQLKLSKKQENEFDEITSFNISARYDTVKLEFYKKATPGFSRFWLNKIKEYKLWLENQF